MLRTMVWALAGVLFGAGGLLAQAPPEHKDKEKERPHPRPCAVGHITHIDHEKHHFTVHGRMHEHKVHCTEHTRVVHEHHEAHHAAHKEAKPGERHEGGHHLTCAVLRQGMRVTVFGEHRGDHCEARLVVIHDEHHGEHHGPGHKPDHKEGGTAPKPPAP